MKRYRKVVAKEGELKVAYGKDGCGEVDLTYAWGTGVPKPDAHMISDFFEGIIRDHDGYTLRENLEERGYDITTLKFSVKKK